MIRRIDTLLGHWTRIGKHCWIRRIPKRATKILKCFNTYIFGTTQLQSQYCTEHTPKARCIIALLLCRVWDNINLRLRWVVGTSTAQVMWFFPQKSNRLCFRCQDHNLFHLSTIMMTTACKQAQLSNEQVRSVFCNVIDETSPCDLEYKVVPTKTRAGPPNRDLEGTNVETLQLLGTVPDSLTHPIYCINTEGIYILCDTHRPGFPRHIYDRVMSESSPKRCIWMATEQARRYVSGDKCGDLWSMVRTVELHPSSVI